LSHAKIPDPEGIEETWLAQFDAKSFDIRHQVPANRRRCPVRPSPFVNDPAGRGW
jgi:hypothetical protein